MSAKSIRFHDLARYKMFAGANMLADAVKVTLSTEMMVAERVKEKDGAQPGGNGMGGMPHGMGV
jgi:hypothetical protein